MNQASIQGLRVGIEKAKADWASNPTNTGTPVVAIQLPLLEELLDDLAAANEQNVFTLQAREEATPAEKKKRKK
ncbi:MAG: hypothetical protein ACREJ1_04550 [Candidatus Methylomirabilales bacterium]